MMGRIDWQNTVSELGPRLFRYFCGTFSQETASDLVQETLIRLVRKHSEGAFDPAQGNLAMYAFGIAHLVQLEAFKTTRREEPVAHPEDLDQRVAEDTDELEVQARMLRQAMSQLTETQREVLLLLIDRELSLEQIGLILVIPVGTVKSHIHRSKERLREIIGKDLGEERL